MQYKNLYMRLVYSIVLLCFSFSVEGKTINCPSTQVLSTGHFFYAEGDRQAYMLEGVAEKRWIFFVFYVPAKNSTEALAKGNEALKNNALSFKYQASDYCYYSIIIGQTNFDLTLGDSQ